MGHCAICNFYAKLQLDHSHSTGYVRGRVCQRCNNVLASIEYGTHQHQTFYFVLPDFVVSVDCSSYHSYLKNPPLGRMHMVYRK